jgi:hypothetical protein
MLKRGGRASQAPVSAICRGLSAKLIKGNTQELPLGRSFDLVVSAGVLHYTPAGRIDESIAHL